MMLEQSLLNILNAANADDAEDVVIRAFLVEVLRERIQLSGCGNDHRLESTVRLAPPPPAVAAGELGFGR